MRTPRRGRARGRGPCGTGPASAAPPPPSAACPASPRASGRASTRRFAISRRLLLGEEAAVLDRADSGPHSVRQVPRRRMRARPRAFPCAPPRRLRRRSPPSVSSATSGWSWSETSPPVVASLIAVGAGAESGAHGVPHRLGPVDEVRRLARIVRDQVTGRDLEPGPGEEAVPVPACLRDQDDGDLQRGACRTYPRAIASAMPRSAPPRSRTNVTPASSVSPRVVRRLERPLRDRRRGVSPRSSDESAT